MQPEKGFCNKFANNLLEIERGNIGKNQNKETALNKKKGRHSYRFLKI